MARLRTTLSLGIPALVVRIAAIVPDSESLTILDIGCGNHSPQYFRTRFPKAWYVGIDKGSYNNSCEDVRAADQLLDLDLEQSSLARLGERAFDVVILSHILEHLGSPMTILRDAAQRVAKGGMIYVAFPHPDSVGFPSHKGTLNFFDDPTHVSVIDPGSVRALLIDCGLRVVYSERPRMARNLALMPIRLIIGWAIGLGAGPALWDLYGFEQVIVAKRPESTSSH